MPYYPDVSEIRRRLEAALAVIPDRYRQGVQSADWKNAALRAADNYYTALQRVIAEKRWDKGIQATSNEAWQTAAVNKGAPIISTRIREALPKWEAHFAPKYQAVISVAKTLPPRTPDFERNIETRLKPIVKAWKGLTATSPR